MGAEIVEYTGTVPQPETMLIEKAIESIERLLPPGSRYRFELQPSHDPCSECGAEASPFMRFSRTIAREAWIVGRRLNADGTPDKTDGNRLVCPLKFEALLDDAAMAHALAELQAAVMTLNLRHS